MDTPSSPATLQADPPAQAAAPVEPEIEYDNIFNFDIIVENTLFRVPRHGFELPGSFFATMFTLPVPKGKEGEVEGVSEKNPIVVEGISKSHFKAFLKILYPLLFKSIADPGLNENTRITIDEVQSANMTFEEWVGVLHLATKWDFFDIRRKAIQKITGMMPHSMTMWEKMDLAKKYHVKRWLLSQYKSLVLPNNQSCEGGKRGTDYSKNMLDVDELLMGGMDLATIVKIFKIRQEYGVPCLGCGHRCLGDSYRSGPKRVLPDLDNIIPEQLAEQFIGLLDT